MSFPIYQQFDQMDCGPTCLRMIAKHYGRVYSLQYLRDHSYIDREGVSLLGISDAAEHIGMHTLAVKLPFKQFIEEVPLPCVAHWRQRHFVVVYRTSKKYVYVADPAIGKIKMTHEEFLSGWASSIKDDEPEGILLLVEPTPDFFAQDGEKIDKTGFKFLFTYLFKYKKLLFQLILGLIVGSLLQLILPFLTQSIVDVGINNQDVDFIYLILFAQLALFLGQVSVNLIRSWILLHIGARINISLISDFLIKLMKLPISFFDTKVIGDLLQRINDHYRIEQFLTSATLSTLFSMVNFVIFGIVLLYYNPVIFLIFIVSSVLYAVWIILFLKKRKELDYKRFDELADNQSKLIQLIRGMQEIKLHSSEKQKRWEWERIQAKLFKISLKNLALEQYQQAGGSFINEFKNIMISFIAATAVINGDMTLGGMLAVQYIIGQLNGPLNQMVNFIRVTQDAKISLERLGEIHNKDNEEQDEVTRMDILPEKGDIELKDLTFQYGGPHSPKVLNNLSLTIPKGKVTAVVGASGSGKTTLLKLLLKFYKPTDGEIRLGDANLQYIKNRLWRKSCGVVMQDGFIFSDSIAKNIAIGDEIVDKTKLLQSVKVANIQGFVESLPLSYNTKIGGDGLGMSGGQMQRMLIARSVYKDPEYLFFDEATSALDANNEATIMGNLEEFFKGKTVVVVAHRLSTVKNADQIIVLDKGQLIEQGTHEELAKLRGAYYRLVKNQLELGN
ncbi:MAG: ATP-binding cassette subfamily B protein [Cognaticolwellia sp.]